MRFRGLRPSTASAAALAVALLFSVTGLVRAQAGAASVYGDIKDQQGAGLPGATVTLTSAGTGASRTTTTNEIGGYRFVALTPGLYTLKIELAGFRTAVHDKLELAVDTATRQDAALALGNVSETIEVAARASIINTTDASLGNTMTERQIQQLPLEARNPVGLLSLQAGATYLPTGDQRSGSVSGARSDQSNVTLDGVDVNDPVQGFAYTTVVRVTLDSLQEFKVSTSNYSADMGRSSAAQVSLVTKGGTNAFHGAGYWGHRNTDWSSNEYFFKLTQLQSGLPSKPPKLDKHNFGGAIGGPIRRDRLFFFGNYEGLREASEDPVVRNVPSPRCATACWSTSAPWRRVAPAAPCAGSRTRTRFRPDATASRRRSWGGWIRSPSAPAVPCRTSSRSIRCRTIPDATASTTWAFDLRRR